MHHLMQQTISPRPQSVVSSITQVSDFSDNANPRTGPYLEGNLKLQGTIETSCEVLCCKFSNQGEFLAVGLKDGSIKIYDPRTCQCVFSLQDEDTKLPVTQIRFRHFSEDEKPEYAHILIATYASGHVKFWHFTSGKCLHTINETRQTLCMALSPSGSRFMTGGDDNMHIYDEETKTRISTLGPSDARDKMDGHRFRVFSAQYHPNYPHVFITGGWDNTVHFWDDRQRHSIRMISDGPHICGDALDIDATHNHILAGSWRKNDVLTIYDFASASKIKDIPIDPMYSSKVYSCQWLGKDNIICGGSDMNMACVIDRGTLNTTGHLGDLPKAVYCIDNDQNGNYPLVAIGSASTIFLVKMEKKS
ncbi:hypothetical protein FSP39_004403 [Pinctada imbricata]|uniref:Anaphase-promoting complex subunit 4-like WD40 domain-containing protein n=1 Tax=Pinctada imbricata TaxID=66713 RepID=A0AA89BJZ2_PINIB|nr:hypothetical protein FSP39_004403 [Pinctada imbricata]